MNSPSIRQQAPDRPAHLCTYLLEAGLLLWTGIRRPHRQQSRSAPQMPGPLTALKAAKDSAQRVSPERRRTKLSLLLHHHRCHRCRDNGSSPRQRLGSVCSLTSQHRKQHLAGRRRHEWPRSSAPPWTHATPSPHNRRAGPCCPFPLHPGLPRDWLCSVEWSRHDEVPFWAWPSKGFTLFPLLLLPSAVTIRRACPDEPACLRIKVRAMGATAS